jgi:hypothetical protein
LTGFLFGGALSERFWPKSYQVLFCPSHKWDGNEMNY